MESSYIHVHSIRGASGGEILIARVLAPDGKIGYGFSFRLDATEARHMAERQAGVRHERPRYFSGLGLNLSGALRGPDPSPDPSG